MYPNDSRFWQYKVYADIRGGFQDLCKMFLFCAGMFGALKPGFRSLATLKLVVNVVGEL